MIHRLVCRCFSAAPLGLVGVLVWPAGPAALAGETSATVVWYAEQEAGREPSRARYIVTDAFLRLDEGNDEGGFVLLDRRRRQIYNVVPETGSVLNIDGRGRRPEPPETLSIAVETSYDAQAPTLEGKRALTVVLRAGDKVCRSAVVVPGLLDDVSAAFGEFFRVLAVQQSRTLDNTPRALQTPCFLARYLYAGDFHARAGLPLLEWSGSADRRELLDYTRNVAVDEALLAVPDGLRSYEIAPSEPVEAPGRRRP
ncbi:MAG: hypothetical protein PVI91_04480 [Gammaproteobacteria bacterium]